MRQTLKCVIPANSPANQPLPFEFVHPNEAKAKTAFALGVAETSNPNNKHYDVGFQINPGVNAIYPSSKKFMNVGENTNLSERFTPFVFTKPDDKKSTVLLVPTEASGAAEIVVQFVIKYSDQAI